MGLSHLKIPARDGFELAATHYQTPAASGRVVVISSAMATPRQFYRHFATALVAAGYEVITWDYRGIGDSAPASLRGFDARMRDWVFEDMTGVLDWVIGSLSPERLFLAGHSAGGQLAGLLERPERVDAMVTVSAQSAYWRLQGGAQKYAVLLHTHVSMPLLSRLFGYLPWSRLIGGTDIPKGVALEWSRWCRDPKYILGDDTLPLERYAAFRAPVLAYSIEDDDWGTAASVDAMMGAYPSLQRRHLDPADFDLRSIGHLGFFRQGSEALWREPIAWLDAM